ncbi:MAG: DUF2330 domain-containing protein, partial [Actinomycetota bacterium]
MRRRLLITSILTVGMLALAGPAFACGGLLSPNGSVNLLKTTTLAAYHQGIEHYITSFRFVGGGGAKFGSIVPLPGVPTNVERGGDWTLQRLIREVRPPVFERAVALSAAGASYDSAKVLLEVEIDALDITVLEGGGAEVARWAEKNGFVLSPDAPEVLDFYADRSPIFLAARFDSKRAQAQGLSEGDGTPIHISIPTPQPWVPLRILGLGKEGTEVVQADVFLLTDDAPSMLPAPAGFKAPDTRPGATGLVLERSEQAGELLMNDLREDKGMDWMPENMWLSYMTLTAPADSLTYDLALDASGAGQPSYVAAGLKSALRDLGNAAATTPWGVVIGVVLALGAALI